MSIGKNRKKQIVKNLVEKLQPAQAVVFADFTGLSTPEIEELRNKVEEQKAYFNIVKNTLLDIACQESHYGDLSTEITTGPTATLLCLKDPIAPIKVLYEFAKSNENLKIKGGFLEKHALTKQEIISLAKLPTKDILISAVIRGIQTPAVNLVYVLQANIKNLIRVLDQATESKS